MTRRVREDSLYGWTCDYRALAGGTASVGDITQAVFSEGTSVYEFKNSGASVDYVPIQELAAIVAVGPKDCEGLCQFGIPKKI